MHISSFLDHLKIKKEIPEYAVICFHGKEYPLLFFTSLMSFFKKNNNSVQTFNLLDHTIASVQAHLSMMSFSGSTLYWLCGFHELQQKKQQEWIDYIKLYTGPHRVIFFVMGTGLIGSPSNNRSMIIIGLNSPISVYDYSSIRFLIDESYCASEKQTALQLCITDYVQQISLDNACLFAHYEIVIGQSIDSSFKHWIVNIIEPTQSLFLLSQYFFGKKSKFFFNQWSTIHERYMPTFWVSFWADQIWRAYIYCDLMQQRRYSEAKKASYKLPFSFINRDWSLLRLDELQKAHQFLFAADFHLKNGGSSVALELFYSMFFDNKLLG